MDAHWWVQKLHFFLLIIIWDIQYYPYCYFSNKNFECQKAILLLSYHAISYWK